MTAYNENVQNLLASYQDELLKEDIPVKEIDDTIENFINDPGCLIFDDPHHRLSHVLYMIQRMQDEAHEWTEGKVNRWLGFIQGVFWCTKRRGIMTLRDESRELYSKLKQQRKQSWLEQIQSAYDKRRKKG
ncbi:MAG: hypothetical protein ACTSYO_08120 [Candidatus Ranarchaeia archaeon]